MSDSNDTGGSEVASAAHAPAERGTEPAARRIRLTLEFDGSGFKGWQRQVRGERTVQGELESALARLPGRHGPVFGAGRTDAGVHALGMVAHVDTTATLVDERFRLALNAHLPRDVVVLDAATVASDFEAQYDCLYRRYLYRMRVVRRDARGLAIDRRRVLPVFRDVDVDAMRAATERIVGRRDFAAFATQETRTTVRTVHLCDLRERRGELRLHIAADGFLRTMVRTIVGTLLWVGKGKLTPADVGEVLASRDRRRAGTNVPPYGLYFVEAGYDAWDAARSEDVAGRIVV